MARNIKPKTKASYITFEGTKEKVLGVTETGVRISRNFYEIDGDICWNRNSKYFSKTVAYHLLIMVRTFIGLNLEGSKKELLKNPIRYKGKTPIERWEHYVDALTDNSDGKTKFVEVGTDDNSEFDSKKKYRMLSLGSVITLMDKWLDTMHLTSREMPKLYDGATKVSYSDLHEVIESKLNEVGRELPTDYKYTLTNYLITRLHTINYVADVFVLQDLKATMRPILKAIGDEMKAIDEYFEGKIPSRTFLLHRLEYVASMLSDDIDDRPEINSYIDDLKESSTLDLYLLALDSEELLVNKLGINTYAKTTLKHLYKSRADKGAKVKRIDITKILR